ncbi:MAG: N-acetyl-gamma-glutamyl-phosphate reductase [Phycisphaerales bacterium JB060]
MTVPVAIAGATGYTGLELIRLVLAHPDLELAGVFASPGGRSVGQRIDEVFPEMRGHTDAAIASGNPQSILACAPRVTFLCTPHEASATLAPALLGPCEIVADLSGAFRLSATDYPTAYGFDHPAPDLLGRAAYALPEHNRRAIEQADLLSCPGCYPTASLLPLRPMLDAGLLAPDRTPFIDAVSGISGAGRAPSQHTVFGEVSLRPYNVFAHRHQPEISRHAGARVLFTPSVAPFFRGMLALVHIDLKPGVAEAELRGHLESSYANSPFVRLLPRGCWPSVGAVERTNHADIGVAFDETSSHAVLACALDNLLKGASGQALQAVNIRLGLDERAGMTAGTTTANTGEIA